jgi:membrane protein
MPSAAITKPDATPEDARERGRGRHAEKPSEVPPRGWLDVLARTKQQLDEDNLTVVAAGVAFYAFLAVVPSLAALIAIYGLVLDPSEIGPHIEALARILPGEVVPLLREQMLRITTDAGAAGIGAIVGFAVALYSSANATKALISGLNIAYDELEKRSFFKLSGIAFVLTLGAILGAVLAVGLLAIMPTVLERMYISTKAETVLNWLRWPLLVGGFVFSLAVMYRYGPSRHDAKWRWVSPGAIAAAVLWLIVSALFALYVSKLAGYDKTYGPLGTAVVFMMWLFLTAYVILLGAELNAELERQTKADTTEGAPKPLGERHARAADTVGPTREEMREKRTQ